MQLNNATFHSINTLIPAYPALPLDASGEDAVDRVPASWADVSSREDYVGTSTTPVAAAAGVK